MSKLLKKSNAFEWTEIHQKSFEDLREALCSAPVLKHPEFYERFILTTNASDFAVGAILNQGPLGEDRPIAYMSKIMKPAEKNYTTTEKECLAVIYAVLHFRPYLFGRSFLSICDHEPLKWIDSVKPPLQRLIRWRTRLREYEYEFLHKSERLNVNVDALSRNPVPEQAVVFPIIPEARVGVQTRSATSRAAAEKQSKSNTLASPPKVTVREPHKNSDPLKKALASLIPTKKTTTTSNSKKPVGRPPGKQIARPTTQQPDVITSRLRSQQKATTSKPTVISNIPKPIRPRQRQMPDSCVSESESNDAPLARARASGFPSLIKEKPPIGTQVSDPQTSETQTPSNNKLIKLQLI